MKLKDIEPQWKYRFGYYKDSGLVSVPDIIDAPIRPEFFRLDDYRVSSVIAGTIWLIPKRTPQ